MQAHSRNHECAADPSILTLCHHNCFCSQLLELLPVTAAAAAAVTITPAVHNSTALPAPTYVPGRVSMQRWMPLGLCWWGCPSGTHASDGSQCLRHTENTSKPSETHFRPAKHIVNTSDADQPVHMCRDEFTTLHQQRLENRPSCLSPMFLPHC